MKYLLTGFTTIVLFLSTVVVLSAQTKDSVQGDFEALQDLYTATGGENWKNNTGWGAMTPETMSDAYGITVWQSGEYAGRVKKVHLFDNNLINIEMSGGRPVIVGEKEPTDSRGNRIPPTLRYVPIEGRELPETLRNLQQMEDFQIHRNYLGGPLPDAIYSWSSVKVIGMGFGEKEDLSLIGHPYPSKTDYNGNKFTGQITSDIGNLVNLERLFLERNYFDESIIPDELWSLSELEMLSISLNGFNGSIPSVEPRFLGLIDLHLHGGTAHANRVFPRSRPPSEEHYLRGRLPESLGLLTELKVLRLEYNHFEGGIPLSWSNLSSLVTFVAGQANLSGEFPNHFNNDNMPDLRTFIISRNDISGTIDPDYNMRSSIVFNILGCNVSGELPRSFIDSQDENFPTGAVIFQLHGNDLSGNFSNDLSDLTRPRFIRISDNNFTGPLPVDYPEALDSDRFNYLWFRNNEFTGAIPATLGNIKTSRDDFLLLFDNNNLSSYEVGAFAPVVLDGNGEYISGLRTTNRFDLQGNSLPASELDKIVLDVWANVESRLGTEWENWGNSGSLKIHNQSTGFGPSNSQIVNQAIQNLRNAGWEVQIEEENRPEGEVLQEPPTAPTLQSPVNNSEVPDNNNIEFLWEEMEGADHYELQLYDASTNERILNTDLAGNVYEYTGGLNPDTSYRWRVRAVKNSVQGDWSNYWEFTVSSGEDDNKNGETGSPDSPQFPDAPVLHGPENSEQGVSITPTFTWSDIGADYYVLHVSRRSPTGMYVDVMVVDTTFTPDEIFDDGTTHDWRVHGVKDGVSGQWTDVHRFTTAEQGLPDVAELVSPVHFAQEVEKRTEFRWEDVGVDFYKIRLRTKHGNDYIFIDETEFANYTPEQTLDDTTQYEWQVKSVSGGMEGAWGPIWEFTTGIYEYIVEAPSPISPSMGSEYDNLTPVFEWSEVEADHYVISVTKEQPSNAKSLPGVQTESVVIFDETTETSYMPETALEPETRYYWRVQAVKEGEEGEWSDVWEFTTPEGEQSVSNDPGEDPLQTSLSQNYPNPFNPSTQIEFTLQKAQEISLVVYDMAGRQVATLVEGVMQAGLHSATFSADHLASGIYIYRFASESHQFTRKMTLVK